MAHLSSLSPVVLAAVAFSSVSANVISNNVTFISRVEGSTCPPGNPSAFSEAFALNGAIGENVTLNVGDELVFTLQTNTVIHPLTMCQNSSVPLFCQNCPTCDELTTASTIAGTTVSHTFTAAGTYYYGCHNHQEMGCLITVSAAVSSPSED
jgi:hypothetical protein